MQSTNLRSSRSVLPATYILTWMPPRILKRKSIFTAWICFFSPSVLHLSKWHRLTSNWINPKCGYHFWLYNSSVHFVFSLLFMIFPVTQAFPWFSQSHRLFPTPIFLLLSEFLWPLALLKPFHPFGLNLKYHHRADFPEQSKEVSLFFLTVLLFFYSIYYYIVIYETSIFFVPLDFKLHWGQTMIYLIYI